MVRHRKQWMELRILSWGNPFHLFSLKTGMLTIFIKTPREPVRVSPAVLRNTFSDLEWCMPLMLVWTLFSRHPHLMSMSDGDHSLSILKHTENTFHLIKSVTTWKITGPNGHWFLWVDCRYGPGMQKDGIMGEKRKQTGTLAREFLERRNG